MQRLFHLRGTIFGTDQGIAFINDEGKRVFSTLLFLVGLVAFHQIKNPVDLVSRVRDDDTPTFLMVKAILNGCLLLCVWRKTVAVSSRYDDNFLLASSRHSATSFTTITKGSFIRVQMTIITADFPLCD